MGKNKRAFLLLALILALAGGLFYYCNNRYKSSPESSSSLSESEPALQPPSPDDFVPEPAPDDGLPSDKLVITPERQSYEDGALMLIIPRLDVYAPVVSGTDDLGRGACLYDYAQLPGEGNRNVSIVAHRDYVENGQVLKGMFYYIDTLQPGDYFYLTDGETIYRYQYYDQKVVEENDWTPILRQGFSCLTLTSCHPVGVASHRIIVRAGLEETIPWSEGYEYLLSTTEQVSQETSTY